MSVEDSDNFSSDGSVGLLGLGNTIAAPSNKKRIAASIRWCFTYNNYPDDWKETVIGRIGSVGYSRLVIGEEVGELCGTPHLQGYVEFTDKCRPVESVKIKQISWRKCKGTDLHNYKYCTEDGKFVEFGFTREWKKKNKLIKVKTIKKLYPWQEMVLKEFKNHMENPDDRAIYWVHCEPGDSGKSTFCKYLYEEHNFGFLYNAKSADIAQYVSTNLKDAYCIDFSRTMDGKINYGAIESLKNGLLFSSKYESHTICMDSPFIVCFANFPPEKEKMSADRWITLDLDDLPLKFIKGKKKEKEVYNFFNAEKEEKDTQKEMSEDDEILTVNVEPLDLADQFL